MKLGPRQIVGLAAIAVFGGLLVFRLTQPSEREVMDRRLASLPSVSASGGEPLAVQIPSQSLPETSIPAPPVPEPPVPSPAAPGQTSAAPGEPADAMPGSQDAKDDLYCWAVLGKEFDARIRTDPPAATPLLDAARLLEASGVGKLEAEGVTRLDNWASLTVAFAENARADYRQNELRIPVEACVERASRLAPGSSP